MGDLIKDEVKSNMCIQIIIDQLIYIYHIMNLHSDNITSDYIS